MVKHISCPRCGNRDVRLQSPESVGKRAEWRCAACAESCSDPAASIGPRNQTNFAVGLAMVVSLFALLICYLLTA